MILGLNRVGDACAASVRGETLKLRELEFVQAATAFGVEHTARIMSRHIAPNVMHLVLITTVLSFSDLILYEAVLTYVGVGVDPSMNSFGGMINLARSEMSRDPVVWWSFAAAFGFHGHPGAGCQPVCRRLCATRSTRAPAASGRASSASRHDA